MASLFTNGKFQAQDATGALSGALLYTYAAGTTTPLATYTLQAGLSSNANPVVCDANGQASVWLGTSSYRMILKTATGVTVWDVDNIVPTLNADSVVYNPHGTSRTVASKLSDFASVEDFGAVGDGVTDDTASIQAALDSGVKTVYAKATYKVSALTISAAITFYGPGRLQRAAVAASPMLAISVSNVTVDGLSFVGGSENTKIPTADAADQGIVVTAPSASSVNPLTNIIIRRVTVNGFAGAGIQLSWVSTSVIAENTVKYCGYAGIYGGSLIDSRIVNNAVSYIDATTSALVNFYGITLTRDSSATTTVSARCTNVQILGNIVHDVPAWTGIDLHAGKNVLISTNRVYYCKNGISAQYDDSTVGNPNKQICEDVVITSNIVEGNVDITTAQIGIAVLGLATLPANRITISDNLLMGCGNYTSATGAIYLLNTNWGVIRNNTCEKSIRQGIALTGTSQYCDVTGNRLNGVKDGSSTGSYMFLMPTNLTGCTVRDNIMSNTTGDATYTPSLCGILYDAINATGVVLARNRITALTGGAYIFKTGGSANVYSELGWELEEESIKFDFTTAGAGAVTPYEQIPDKSASFRRLPYRGTNEIVHVSLVLSELSGSNQTKYGITNPLKVYTPWVYRHDGVATPASDVLAGITFTIRGVFWTQ